MAERIAGGTVVFDTPEDIAFFRLTVLKQGLKAEIRGFRLTSKGPTAYSQLKKMGYKGSRETVLANVEADIEAALVPTSG